MEALTLVGAFVSASFWVMRFALSQQRAITDRFIAHLERMLEEQRRSQELNRQSLAKLTGAVRRSSSILRRLAATRASDGS